MFPHPLEPLLIINGITICSGTTGVVIYTHHFYKGSPCGGALNVNGPKVLRIIFTSYYTSLYRNIKAKYRYLNKILPSINTISTTLCLVCQKGDIFLWREGSKSFCHMSPVVNVAKLVDFVIGVSHHHFLYRAALK